jgi:hypothetical protein
MWGETGLHQILLQTDTGQACRRPGVGRTGRHGIARSWASSEPCIATGAAERDEGLAAPVVPALDRDNRDAAHHLGGGEADYAGGGSGDVQAEQARDRAITRLGSRRVNIEREFADKAREISESEITPLPTSRGRAMKSLRIPRSDEFDYCRVPAWSMSASDLDTACDRLGVVDSAKRKELHTAVIAEAGRYLRRTKQEKATPPLSRQKAQLVKVENAAGQLVREVEKLATCLDAEFALLHGLRRQSRDARICNSLELATPRTLADVLRLIAWLRDGAADGSSFVDDRPGPKSRPSLHLFVLSLCSLYKQITGKQATHNPHDKTEYTGTPRSEAGRFVEFIVQLVDPEVTSTQISTAMSFVVSELRHQETT